MTRVYDHNQPVRQLNPMQIATLRAERLTDPIDRKHFMDAFAQGRVAASRGDERAYLWFRSALDADHSATVAGLIEGAASINEGKTVF